FSLLRRRHVRNVKDVVELDNITYSTITICEKGAIFTTKRLNGSRGCIKKMKAIVVKPNVVVYGKSWETGFRSLLHEMVESGLTPNEKTFDRSTEEMLEVGVQVNVIRCTCLVQCLGKTKRIDDLINVSIQRRINPDDRLCECLI
ncbi:LOW QUALITY PROTEIN: hypothetical protein HID58_048746, partial [Brassica napus]